MNKKFIKQQLKGITVTDSAVGTRTPNILMGEHAGEYVRGDIMDANAVILAFDELKDGVDEGHDTLKELNEEIKTNATVINGVITKVNKLETSVNLEFDKKADKTAIPTKVSQLDNDAKYLTEHQPLTDYVKNTEFAGLLSKVTALESRIAALESKHAE